MTNTSDDKPIRYRAVHEAAHAVVGVLLGSPPDEVTIEPNADEGTAGHAVLNHGSPYDDRGGEDWNLMVRAITCYAGHMATLRLGYDEDYEEAGAANDYHNALSALDSIAGGDESELQRFGEFAKQVARMMVDLAWDQIEDLAELVEHETTITREQVFEWLQPVNDEESQRKLIARYPWLTTKPK